MKKQILVILAIVTLIPLCVNASHRDIKDILGSIANRDSSGGGKVSDVIGAINRVTGNDRLTFGDLVGEWKYAAPAVAFKSDNLLKNAGGVAAASQIERKIEPYYAKAGFRELKMSFGADSTFTMQVKGVKMTGKVLSGSDGGLVFKFNAFGKVSLGQMNACVARYDTSSVSLMFDAAKLITLVDRISAITGNSTLQTTSALLKSYDGLTIGFRLDRQREK